MEKMESNNINQIEEDNYKPFFNEEQREKLRGKYTSWAEYIDEETLFALLWMVGEYGIRSQIKWPITPGIYMPWYKIPYMGDFYKKKGADHLKKYV